MSSNTNNTTIALLRKKALLQLEKKHISTRSLDCDLLLTHVLKKPRVFLYAHPEYTPTKKQVELFTSLVINRCKRIPLAYLIYSKKFYGRDFFVNSSVLIPRPETETLVEQVLAFLTSKKMKYPIRVLDIGVGSGCIPLTLACEWHKDSLVITAIDISKKALLVSKKNHAFFKKHGIFPSHHTLSFKQISHTPQRGTYDIITANLPYLSTAEYRKACHAYPEISAEPKNALISALDGLNDIITTIQQLPSILSVHGVAFFECSTRQEKKLQRHIKNHLPKWKWSFTHSLSKKTSVLMLQRDLGSLSMS